jgi:hypothetical protein
LFLSNSINFFNTSLNPSKHTPLLLKSAESLLTKDIFFSTFIPLPSSSSAVGVKKELEKKLLTIDVSEMLDLYEER